MKRPTYREIAAACDVSSSTVSRALNNDRRIPEATRQRIRRKAEKMGWKPNPFASAYMAHLRSTHPPSYNASLGIVVDYPPAAGGPASHIRRVCTAFKQRAAEYGFQSQTFNLQEPGMSLAVLDRTLYNRNIPGFIITGLHEPAVKLEGIDWSQYAVLAMGYSVVSPALNRVTTNVIQGFKLVIEKAFELGYRHVGVSISREYDDLTNNGVLMPLSYIRQNLKPSHTLDVFVFDRNTPTIIPDVAAWLTERRPQLAVGSWVGEAIESLAWRIPEDIALVTFDHSPEWPQHAGLDQQYEASGCLAADVLISEVTHNRRGLPTVPVEYTIAGRWLDGPSAPPYESILAPS